MLSGSGQEEGMNLPVIIGIITLQDVIQRIVSGGGGGVVNPISASSSSTVTPSHGTASTHSHQPSDTSDVQHGNKGKYIRVHTNTTNSMRSPLMGTAPRLTASGGTPGRSGNIATTRHPLPQYSTEIPTSAVVSESTPLLTPYTRLQYQSPYKDNSGTAGALSVSGNQDPRKTASWEDGTELTHI